MPYVELPTIVLGGDGFLGRNLVEHWRTRGWPVHPVGRAAGDFTDAAVVDRVFRDAPPAGRILHAITKQRTGAIQYEMQGELLRDNARIHLNVLDAWRAHQPQAKLISLGSSCVYPESAQPLPEDAFRTGPPHPSVRGYALAKELLAVGCETFGAQYGLRWLHCILATVYGPHAHTEEHRSHFMAALIARAAAGKARGDTEFEVWGSPGTVRDLLYVTDQIDAVIAADQAFENRILNVTSNQPVTIGQCASDVLRAFDWPARIVHPAGSFQGAGYKSLDSSRFLSATGWQPRFGIEAGVRAALAGGLAQEHMG
ncbi:MAG: NAD-dependent epimerase/dehydratase family protein [Proteobacteria bacterium]|nr:NAD-dependent epimerase/dehydratase family protein [Pseudomonadota bacterium]